MKKVIVFKAIWCGPCRAIAPMIDELTQEYAGRIEIASLDIDKNVIEAIKYNVSTVPTILFLRGEDVVDTHRGALTKTALRNKLDNL